MARPSATDRLHRLLTIVPWIAERDGPRIDEVCDRFGLSRTGLLAELQTVWFVGRYPYTPENLIDIEIDEERVWISYTNFFERPLRLTHDEALTILAAGVASMETETNRAGRDCVANHDGDAADSALARALGKVAAALDVDLGEDLRVVLTDGSGAVLDEVRRGLADHRVMRIDYFSHARNEDTTRDVEPLRLFNTEGSWYLTAWCRLTEADKVFKVDRITSAVLLDEVHGRAAPPPDPTPFAWTDEHDRVVLEVDAEGAWVVEQYPVEDVVATDDGGRRLTLAVTARPWLERLLLRLGPHGRVVDAPDHLRDVGPTVAARLLALYAVEERHSERPEGRERSGRR